MVQVKTRCCGEVICAGTNINVAVWRAALEGVSLAYADLRGESLMNIKLRNTNLSYADLRGCIFDQSNLTGSNLTGALLEGASFRGANLTDVNYPGTNLRRIADITGANMDNSCADADSWDRAVAAAEPVLTGTGHPATAVAQNLVQSITYNPEAGRWRYKLSRGNYVYYNGHDRDMYERIKREVLGIPTNPVRSAGYFWGEYGVEGSGLRGRG